VWHHSYLAVSLRDLPSSLMFQVHPWDSSCISKTIILLRYILTHLVKGKAVPITGSGGSQGWAMSRRPHLLDNWLTGCTHACLMNQPTFIPRMIPGIYFCSRLIQSQDDSEALSIRSMEKTNNIGNRTHDLLACSGVPILTHLTAQFSLYSVNHYTFFSPGLFIYFFKISSQLLPVYSYLSVSMPVLLLHN
jgi:hypothetical protein